MRAPKRGDAGEPLTKMEAEAEAAGKKAAKKLAKKGGGGGGFAPKRNVRKKR